MSDLDKEIMISQRELKDVMAACYDRIIRLEKRIGFYSGHEPMDITPADVLATIIPKPRKADGSS